MSLLILLDLFKKTFQIVGFSPHPQFLSDHLAQNAHSEGDDYRIGGRKSTLRLAVNSQHSPSFFHLLLQMKKLKPRWLMELWKDHTNI